MTSRPIHPFDLLALADRLVGRGAAAGRPRTVDLRAGVSRAYYAVFHELTASAAEMLVSGSVSSSIPPAAQPAARWLSHTDLRKLADAVGGRGNRALVALMAGWAPSLVAACESFVSLQDQRYLADYDHALDLDRYSALTAVDEARSAIEALEALRGSGDAGYLRFLRAAAGSVHVARDRR